MRLPIVKQLFSNNDTTIKQTDIVMLLTPRIIRTHDLSAQDLSPIYIGTQSNMALTGPPATIGGEPTPTVPPPPANASPAAPPAATPPGTPTQPTAMRPPAAPVLPTGTAPQPVIPPGSSPIPGMTTAPAAPPAPAPAQPTTTTPPVATEPAPAPPAPAPAAPTPAAPIASGPPARITLSPPSEMRVGSGPYTVPISVAGANRLSTLTVSITYNPALVRVRSVQEGTFMRQGGIQPAFNSNIDEKSGRIDIVITRPGDQTGASTSGLLAAILVEPLAAGTGSLSLTGAGTVPGGAQAALQFVPAGITVR
jgi:hypothetical protein